MDLGWVGLSQFLPVALLSLWAGGVADRFDRKRILILCRIAYSIGALALAVLANVEGWGVLPIYAVLVMLGATRAFAAPAGNALLPGLVHADRLPRAIALSSTTFQIGTIAGPALGGAIYAVGGGTTAYVAAAGFELAAVVLLLVIRRVLPAREPPREVGVALLVSGVKYVWREKVLLGAISLDLFAVLLGGAVALMPIYARDILHVGEVGLGALRAAPAAGAAIVAITLAARPLSRHAGAKMLAGVVVFGIATIVFGVSESFPLSLVALAALGGADMISVIVRQSLVQLRTADAMRGRVASVNAIFIGASNELGEFESGVTAAWLGVVPAVVVGGIGTIAVAALWAVVFPQLRKIDRLEPPAAAGG